MIIFKANTSCFTSKFDFILSFANFIKKNTIFCNKLYFHTKYDVVFYYLFFFCVATDNADGKRKLDANVITSVAEIRELIKCGSRSSLHNSGLLNLFLLTTMIKACSPRKLNLDIKSTVVLKCFTQVIIKFLFSELI